ncbi:MAG: citrate lyase holo-[acyl-carrier protein] synthase [Clostridiaceae bacterium]
MSRGTLFIEGITPSLEEVLETREMRAGFEKKLSEKYPEDSIISFKLNIPGPVKNSDLIKMIFDLGTSDIKGVLLRKKFEIQYEKELNLRTGPEFFLVINGRPDVVKTEMANLEEETPLGRLYDIDVVYDHEGRMESIDRTKIGFQKRTCFVCDKDAKVCGRSRAHSISDMHDKIEELLKKERRLTL